MWAAVDKPQIFPEVDDSLANASFSMHSTSSDDDTSKTGKNKNVTLESNRRIIDGIINKIFEDRTGQYEASSSHCSSVQPQSSEYSYDKRLKYWKDVIAKRGELAQNIHKKTGKHPADVLFGRQTTSTQRDKEQVKRLMDYAERMKPEVLLNKQQLRLKGYVDPETCAQIPELRETLPHAERHGGTVVEISGMPTVTKDEQLLKPHEYGIEKSKQWLESEVLKQRINEKCEDIDRVIEFYPDVENLQVVGKAMLESNALKHNSDIELLGEQFIHRISSDTSVCVAEREEPPKPSIIVEEPPVPYAIKINDTNFKLESKRSSKMFDLETRFTCEPYQKLVKRVLYIENTGTHVLNGEWTIRPYYPKNVHLLKAHQDEFIFNNKAFRLMPGTFRNVIVQFQPRRVGIVKEKWTLKLDPQFFCRRADAIALKFYGLCKPPPEYVKRINDQVSGIIEKSNLGTLRKLTTGLASITPLIKPDEVTCPYQRLLDERERFEFYNEGFKCHRFHDLELLKEIYNRIKMPRERPWDLHINSLQAMILRLETPDMRALVFGEMTAILDQMRGVPLNFEEKLKENKERDQTRFVYVRGSICTGIDDWENLMLQLEEVFFKPAIKDYYEKMLADEEEGGGPLLLPEEDDVRNIVFKEMKKRKCFRDSLYLQTYSHLCNLAEDIVSVIESTEVI